MELNATTSGCLNKRNTLIVGLLATGLATIAALYLRGTISPHDARIIAIVFVCMALWATSLIEGALVSLLFFFLAATMTSVPAPEIFSGFASSAFWLVFSGAVIGFAVKDSGLGMRVGNMLARCIGSSYLRALLAFATLSFLLSLVMPSTFGRVAILVPIAAGYCDAVRLTHSANGRRGILLLVIVGSYELAAAVLPANLPNVIMAGVLEQSHGIRLSFSEYLLYFAPAGVIVRAAVLVFVSHRLFADSIGAPTSTVRRKPLTRPELHVLLLLGLTLALWFTDSIHHVAPGWVGLGFALVYFLTSPTGHLARFMATLKLDLLWFIAAIIGITALINHLDVRMPGAFALESLRDNPLVGHLVLSASSIFLCFVATSNAEPAIFVPLASRLLGHSAQLKAGLLAQVMGYATTFLPYQSPPIVFGNELAGLGRASAVKYCLWTALLGVLFVLPVNALWWRVIGFL